MSEDGRLLRLYREQGSEAAFARLAARHLDFVYATCLRETNNAAVAEEAAQVVFLLLAKKAPQLRPDQSLSGWLFQTARFAARNARRRGERRKAWEEQAMAEMPSIGREGDALWDRIAPAVNDALAALGAKDREAVLLRFAEGLSFPELGTALGTSEDAARMRLNRAVDRLRRFFAKEGVTLSVAALTGLLADRTAQAAPATCAAAVANIAGSVAAGAGGTATISPNIHSQFQGALKAMTLSKLKLAATIAIGVTLAGSLPFVTRAQNPPGGSSKGTRTTISTTPAPRAASGSAQAGRAGNTSLTSLNQLRLSRPFTLKYTAVIKDVSTPEMWATTMKWKRLQYEFDIKSGITEADAADSLRWAAENMGKRQPDAHFDVTVSSDGDSLFYERTEANNKQTIIYSGDQTYNYETGTHRLIVDPGLRFGQMSHYPIPGAAIPHLPLLRSSAASGTTDTSLVRGDVLETDADTQGGQYRHGEIALADDGGSKKISTMTLLYRNFPIGRWDFLVHRTFQGVLIASVMRLTTYAPVEFVKINAPNQKPWRPQRIIEYELVSASDDALAAAQFDPAGLVSLGDQVQQNTPHRSKAIGVYGPDPGAVVRQMEGKSATPKNTAVATGAGRKVGGLLLIALALAGGAGLLWRRQQSRR